jgi:hypothetical protein
LDGYHTITITATLGEETTSEAHTFFIDGKRPKIVRQYPSNNKYTSGTFTVVYTENNLKQISLYYKGVGEEYGLPVTRSDCDSGKNMQCVFSVDLSDYNGEKINYYFVVEDFVGSTRSREYKETVNTVVPEIDIISPQPQMYDSRMVLLDIKVNEKVKLEYSDDGRFKKLCNNCDSYYNIKRFGFGTHTLQIRATDKVGYSDIETVTFTVA